MVVVLMVAGSIAFQPAETKKRGFIRRELLLLILQRHTTQNNTTAAIATPEADTSIAYQLLIWIQF